ncbi:MAG: GntR family transcriptional regulator [Magnetovibrio sp.]|nr:GntR family transcriptional regulator [Magnetovibrio sp.]
MKLERDRAYTAILTRLSNVRRDPTAPLSERKLAESLGVGRTPVREAFRDLARDGVLEVLPARGTFVRRLDIAELRELYEVRQALEGLAARLAAQRGPTPALDAYGAHMREVIDDTDAFELAEVHRHGVDFHLEIIRSSGNSYLLKTYEPMRLKFAIVLNLLLHYDDDRVREAVREHYSIYDAIRRGDGDDVEAAE